MSEILVTTLVSGLTPRMSDGIPIEQAFPGIRSVLGSRLGSPHAALFAEPRRNVEGITWVSQSTGTVQPLGGVDLARQAAVMSRIKEMLADARVLADRIAPESRSARETSRVLRAMAVSPAPQHVFLVNDQPVIVLWSHDTHVAAAAPTPVDAPAMPTLGRAAPMRPAGTTPQSPTPTQIVENVGLYPVWVRPLAWIVPIILLLVLVWLILQEPLRSEARDPARTAEVAELRQKLAMLSVFDPRACARSAPR